ncbi:MAG: SDR family NAD(P)-dependent oxidoreductase, partial [Streptomyces sp.]|nr:SDR family NAD(P)-dependent oxidoreductase [Streptomyces sp.]
SAGEIPPLVLAPLAPLAPLTPAAPAGAGAEEVPAAVEDALHTVLRLMQDWLAQPRFAASRLVLVTRDACADGQVTHPDPAAAAVWGFVRAAQTENPGRFTLLDTDHHPASQAVLAAAAATGETQLKIRAGTVSTPALRPAPAPATAGLGGALGTGSVLITGGTSGLGALLARHLVARHGVRSLVLSSRRGAAAPAAAALREELTAAGAHVEIVACDVTRRAQVADLLAAVPAAHPLTAVVHCAGVLDDGVVAALTPDRVDTVLAPKVHGAWHLHELTRPLKLSAFVLFSSVASVLGTAGQANYAAANAFLNHLAETRRAEQLPARALCFGFWAERSEMSAALSDADVVRMQRQGVQPLTSQEGLALFDAALRAPESTPVLVPVRLHPAALTPQPGEMVSPLLRTLAPPPAPDGGQAGGQPATASLAERLPSLPAQEAQALLLDAVRAQTALVLGHPDTDRVTPAEAFKKLGIDSLTALELRNKLAAVTGLKLPATLVFDHPNPAALAQFLAAGLTPDPGTPAAAGATALVREIEELGARLKDALPALAAQERTALATLLGDLHTGVRPTASAAESGLADQISSASAGELLALLDQELG